MALAFEGFSIREYTSKMRSIDVLKCWPFDGGEVKLPPMTVAKFRLWSDVVESGKPGLETRSGFGEAVLVDLGEKVAEVSREERRGVRNVKARTPKKRSIAEIFAVAPQIETAFDEHYDDDDDDDDDDCDVDRGKDEDIEVIVDDKELKNKKFKKKKVVLEEDGLGIARNLKVKKRKRLKKDEHSGFLNKDKVYALKLQAPAKFASKLNGLSCSKRLIKDVMGAVSICKKKRSLKRFSTQKKLKVSNTIGKHRKPIFPVRSILKNQQKHISLPNSTTCDTHDSIQSDRHVRFSGKDDILGPRNKGYSKLSPIYDLAPVEVSGSDEDISTSSEFETIVQSATEKKQLTATCDHANIPNFLRPHIGIQPKAKHSDISTSLLPYDHSYAETSSFHYNLNQGYNPMLNSTKGSFSRAATVDCFGNSFPGKIPSSSVSMNENPNSRLPFLSQTASPYEAFSHMSPKELMGSICSFPANVRGEKCMDVDFVGWPLNSQGELIQLNSSGRSGFNHLKQPANLTAPTPEQLKLLPVKYVKENPNIPLANGRTNVHWLDSIMGISESISRLDSELNLGKGKVHMHDKPPQMSVKPVQPTVRLMGKDVIVGRSNGEVQGIGIGKVWTDKEIITEHRPTSIIVDYPSVKSPFQRDWLLHQSSEKSKETDARSLEFQSNRDSQRFLQLQAPETRFINWQNNVAHQNGIRDTNMHLFSRQHVSPEYRQTPANSCQHMRLNSAEIIYKRNLPLPPKRAFEFPFSDPDRRENGQPPWVQFPSSSTSLPPWLVHATQQKETFITSKPYPDQRDKHHPCNMSTANFFSVPSPSHSPVFPYRYDSSMSDSQIQSSSGPMYLARPPIIPLVPKFKATSSVNTSYRNRVNAKDRMKSKPSRFRDPELGMKSRKRPAVRVDDPTKTTKLRSLDIDKDCSGVTGLPFMGNFGSYLQCGPTEIEKDGLRFPSRAGPSKLDGGPRSGPIKLSAGAKHILKPSQITARDSCRPTHSTIPFAATTNSAGTSDLQKKTSKIYRL